SSVHACQPPTSTLQPRSTPPRAPCEIPQQHQCTDCHYVLLDLDEDLSEDSLDSLDDFENLMTPEMAKERLEDYLCWVKMAESRLNEPISPHVRGLLRHSPPK
ncbi:uncharacterized protein C22orf42-like, partial [Hylobates moloch]|uniref:uncharacterized protein C22orf42-like n=1 Tax=Hylobates moloch TaxID=81572 RepID=UPI00267729A3